MMKIILTCLTIFAASAGSLFGQSVLEARFGSATIQQAQGTEKLEILQFQNLHGYAVQDLSGKKDVSEFPDALEVEILFPGAPALNTAIENGSFELFAYDFPMANNTNLYYRVGNSSKILVIYPITTVKKLFEEQ